MPEAAVAPFICSRISVRSGLSSDQFADRLLNEAGVAVLPGTAFGDYGEGYIRLSFANSLTNIEEALARIR